jgi:plasmid stability protein
MAVFTIRDLPESVRSGLRARAARKGRSMEAEALAILAAAVQSEVSFDPLRMQNFIAGLFNGKPPRLTRDLIAERRRETRRELRKGSPPLARLKRLRG